MFDALAERKILEAQARGEFDALPGADRPLVRSESRAGRCRGFLAEPSYYARIMSRLG